MNYYFIINKLIKLLTRKMSDSDCSSVEVSKVSNTDSSYSNSHLDSDASNDDVEDHVIEMYDHSKQYTTSTDDYHINTKQQDHINTKQQDHINTKQQDHINTISSDSHQANTKQQEQANTISSDSHQTNITNVAKNSTSDNFYIPNPNIAKISRDISDIEEGKKHCCCLLCIVILISIILGVVYSVQS